jgi:glycosyltransferase involved in cell wall biosynthesis
LDYRRRGMGLSRREYWGDRKLTPQVSIITPSYHSSLVDICNSMKSLEEQTNVDFEWIIIFDGKDSQYPENSLFKNLPFTVKLGLTYGNYGPSVARNIGFQISDGDIIAYLDMGDKVANHRVQTLIDGFSDGKTSIMLSPYNIVEPAGTTYYDPWSFANRMGRDKFLDALYQQNIIIPLGLSHTRRPFVEVGGFQRGIVCGEDGILLRRMKSLVSNDRIKLNREVAGYYYVSKDGQSRTQRRFDEGGFAFDGSNSSGGGHGQYLDGEWYTTYNSKPLFEMDEDPQYDPEEGAKVNDEGAK